MALILYASCKITICTARSTAAQLIEPCCRVQDRRQQNKNRALFKYLWNINSFDVPTYSSLKGKTQNESEIKPYFEFYHVTLTLKLASLYFLTPWSNIRSTTDKVRFKIISSYTNVKRDLEEMTWYMINTRWNNDHHTISIKYQRSVTRLLLYTVFYTRPTSKAV
jgi:hypothetical protein